MPERSRLRAHLVFELDSADTGSAEAICAAIKSAIQVGLGAHVLHVDAHELAKDETPPAPEADLKPPPSSASDKDQVIEEYLHAGMKIQICRDAGSGRPTYFAVVINPATKSAYGSLVEGRSYVELRAAAEARARKKAVLWRKLQERQGGG